MLKIENGGIYQICAVKKGSKRGKKYLGFSIATDKEEIIFYASDPTIQLLEEDTVRIKKIESIKIQNLKANKGGRKEIITVEADVELYKPFLEHTEKSDKPTAEENPFFKGWSYR